jgi:hypothetical protein
MAEVPQKQCRACHEHFPATHEYFYKASKHGLRHLCRACDRARLAGYKGAAKARRAAERAQLQADRAAGKVPPPKPHRLSAGLLRAPVAIPPRIPRPAFSWRDIVAEEAGPEARDLVRQMVKLAKQGDASMLRLIGAQLATLEDRGESELTRSLRELTDARIAQLDRQYGEPGAAERDSDDAGSAAAGGDGGGLDPDGGAIGPAGMDAPPRGA